MLPQINMKSQQNIDEKYGKNQQNAQDDVNNQVMNLKTIALLCKGDKSKHNKSHSNSLHRGKTNKITKEEFIIPLTHTAAYPWAMMIESFHTHITFVAVSCSGWTIDVTGVTKFYFLAMGLNGCGEEYWLFLADGVIDIIIGYWNVFEILSLIIAIDFRYNTRIHKRKRNHQQISKNMKKSCDDSQIPVVMTGGEYIGQGHTQIDDCQCGKIFFWLGDQKPVPDLILEVWNFGYLVCVLGLQFVHRRLYFLLGCVYLIHFFIFAILLKLNISLQYYLKFQFCFANILMQEDEIAKARQQKQAYICENVQQDQYEDFYDFCNSYAGVIDIDSWTISYVYEIVAKFKDYMKEKDQKQEKHQKSFAIYQTTTVDNVMGGNASQLQMNSVLQTLEQNTKPVQQPKKVTSPPANKKTPEPNIKNNQNPKPFAKKQAQITQKVIKNEMTALQLLNRVAEDTNKSVMKQQSVSNSSFFDINFWQVPKPQETKPNKVQTKNPVVTSLSPKPQHKTIKLNINVNELNANSQKSPPAVGKKIEEPVNMKKTPQVKGKSSNKNIEQNKAGSGKKVQLPPTVPAKTKQVQTFNYANQSAIFDNFFNIGAVKTNNVPVDFQSQFDTFSMIAQQQIKKKKSNTISISSSIADNQSRIRAGTSIQLKQVRELKTRQIKQPFKGPRVFQKEFTDQVFCVKTAIRPQFSVQNLKVQLKNYQIVQRSIFSSNYIMYNMHISPMGIICKRNYEDFTKLKATLQKFYPGTQMPYLEKEGWRADTSTQHAKRQGQMLQLFLADIIRNPQLKNSRVTQQFLTIQDHKKMKRKFQQYDKMTKFKSIQQLCLLNGKVQVSLTEKHRIYNDGMSKLVVKIQGNLQKYRKNCQTLCHYYSQSMQVMLSIDDILKQMQKDIQDFNKTVTINQIQNLEKSLKRIRETYKQNYFRTKFQKNIIESNISLFLRYQKQNTHASKQIIDVTNNLTARYLKRMQSQPNHTVDSSYLSKAFNQHKQGILQQSKNIVVLKYQAGFMQVQASSQLQRILQNLGYKIDNLWKQIGKQYLEQLAKSVNLYSSII